MEGGGVSGGGTGMTSNESIDGILGVEGFSNRTTWAAGLILASGTGRLNRRGVAGARIIFLQAGHGLGMLATFAGKVTL